MELSSHVITNLNHWVEDDFINTKQCEAIVQLMENAIQDAYWAGQASMNVNYDDSFDSGLEEGYNVAKAELEETMKDFQQGWEHFLIPARLGKTRY